MKPYFAASAGEDRAAFSEDDDGGRSGQEGFSAAIA